MSKVKAGQLKRRVDKIGIEECAESEFLRETEHGHPNDSARKVKVMYFKFPCGLVITNVFMKSMPSWVVRLTQEAHQAHHTFRHQLISSDQMYTLVDRRALGMIGVQCSDKLCKRSAIIDPREGEHSGDVDLTAKLV